MRAGERAGRRLSVALVLRHAPDSDWRGRGAERVVVDQNRGAGHVGAVVPVASAVHIEAVAQRRAQLDVVPRLIGAAGSPVARDRVAVGIKQVPLDERRTPGGVLEPVNADIEHLAERAVGDTRVARPRLGPQPFAALLAADILEQTVVDDAGAGN